MLKYLAMLALVTVPLASAKTYNFTVNDPAQAGQAKLQAGRYKLQLEGSQVVLKDSKGHQINAAAKVEPAKRKFDQTAIITSKQNGADRIDWIELGGTKDKVVFQQ